MSSLTVASVLQIVVGLGLLNVWLVRSKSATAYRGGEASSLRDEFAVYGLPSAVFYLVGALKITAAAVFIADVLAGSRIDLPVGIAAGVVAALMVGALIMHVKVRDPIKKAVPASVMLAMSATIMLVTA